MLPVIGTLAQIILYQTHKTLPLAVSALWRFFCSCRKCIFAHLFWAPPCTIVVAKQDRHPELKSVQNTHPTEVTLAIIALLTFPCIYGLICILEITSVVQCICSHHPNSNFIPFSFIHPQHYRMETEHHVCLTPPLLCNCESLFS